jgi:plastocyanin
MNLVAEGFSSNGKLAASLAPGDYQVMVSPNDKSIPETWINVSVADDLSATLDGNLTTTDGIGEISFLPPNLLIKVINPTESGAGISSACVDIYQDGGPGMGSCQDYAFMGTNGFTLPDGTWNINVRPNVPEFSSRLYHVTVSGSTMTVTDSDNVTLIPGEDGVYNLPGEIPNVSLHFVGAGGSSLTQSNTRQIQVCLEKYDGSNWIGYDNSCNGAQGDTFAAKVPTVGQYRARVEVFGDSSIAGKVTGPFDVTNLSELVTVPNVTLPQSQLQLSVSFGNQANLRDSQIEVLKDGQNVTWINTGFTGRVGVAFDSPGSYVLKVHAPQSVTGAGMASYQVTVSNQLVPSLSGGTINDDGSINLALSSANIVGRVTDSTGNPYGTANRQKFTHLDLQKLDGNGNWQWTNTYGDSAPDGTFGFTVEEPGTYRVKITPFGDLSVASTIGSQFVVPSGGLEHYDLGDIRLKAPNLALKVVAPGTTTAIAQVCVNLFTVSNNNNSYADGQCTSSSGQAKFNLANGVYRIQVWPNTAGYTGSWYDISVTNNVASVSKNGQALVAAGNGEYSISPALPNLTGTVKDASGSNISVLGGSAWVVAQVLNQNGDWDWTEFNGNTAGNGTFAINITQPGTYRLRIEPRGLPGSAVTTTSQFVVADASTFNRNLEDVQLQAPNLRIAIVDPTTGLIIQGSNFNIMKVENGARTYVGGTGIDQSAVGISLEDGTYQLEVNPNKAGLAQKIYTVSVSNGSATVTGVSKVNGVFNVVPALPNVRGTILGAQQTPVGNQGGNVWVSVQKKDQYGNFVWVDGGASNNGDGTFGLNLTLPGIYRLKFNVNNIQGVSSTYSDQFTIVDESSNLNLGNVQLPTPNFKVTGTSADGQSQLQFGSVNLFKLDAIGNRIWLDGGSAQLSSFNVTEDGSYVVEVYPNASGQTAKRYSFTFANGSVTPASNVSQNQAGVWQLAAGQPNVTGVIKKPDGSSISLANGQWISVNLQKWNAATSNWDWTDNWSNTLSSGSFSVSVEQSGRYRLRFEPQNVPGSTVSFSSAFDVTDPGTFTKTFTGSSAVQLASPNLQIKVATQAGAALANPNVNIFRNNVQGNNWVDGRGGNASVFSFNLVDGDYSLEVNPNEAGLTAKRYHAVVSNGSVSIDGVQIQNGVFTLTPGVPNVTGTMKDSNGHVVGSANGVWIGFAVQKLDSNGNWQWSSWSNVNQDGSFGANITEAGTYRLRFEPHGSSDLANSYSSTFNIAGPSSTQNLGDVSLATPNLKVKFASGSHVFNNAWIEVFEIVDGNQQWADSQGTGDGKVALNVSKQGTYKLIVHPNDSSYADKSYSATVSQSGSLTIQGASVGQDGYFTLSGATPNVTATIVTSTDAVLADHSQWTNVNLQKLNSWGGWDWTNTWANVSPTGQIAMNVSEPGTYRLRIEPHNGDGVALTFSETFDIRDSGSSKAFGTIRMKTPNLTFTLKDASGQAVANANVSIWAGSWSLNASSGEDGKVSLNVDSAAIVATNGWTTGSHAFHIVVDPPWGRSDIVRWECDAQASKVLCDQLPLVTVGQAYGQHDLGNVTFAQPNVSVQVKTPSNQSVGVGSWVVLWRIVCDQNNSNNCHREWFAGSQTGSDGKAAFNIPDAQLNDKFAVEVNAPWAMRKDYSQTVLDNSGANFTVTELSSTVMSLRAPNLRLVVKQSDGASNSRWSGIGIEKVDTSDSFVSWVTGIGTDDQGFVSVKLDDGRYRLNVNPGPGASGSATKCIVTVTSGVVAIVPGKCDGATGDPATNMQLTLSRGNLVGKVTGLSGAALKGAIVVVTNANNSGESYQTTTDTEGNYGFQLAPGSQWSLKVLYVDPDPLATAYSPSTPITETVPGAGARTEDVALMQVVA